MDTFDNRYADLKILIADDQGLMVDLMHSILTSYNCTHIYSEFCGEGAIEQHKVINPDVTLLDIDMPKKNGIQALTEILQFSPDAFVVMVSAAHSADNVKEAIKAGAKGFIVKPYNSKRIASILDKYLTEKVS